MDSGRGLPEYRGAFNARSEGADTERRMDALMLIGKVFDADYKAGKVRVRIKTEEGEGTDTDWIPWSHDRAGNNRSWVAPEVGEQVLVFCPTGNLQHSYVSGGLNYSDWSLLADSPDVERRVWLKKPTDDFFAFPFWDHLRTPGKEHAWRYFPETGAYRWEIGDKSVLYADKEKIMFQVAETKLVIDAHSIKLHIDGGTTELRLTPDKVDAHVNHASSVTITAPKVEVQSNQVASVTVGPDKVQAQVAGNAVFQITEHAISQELIAEKVRLSLLQNKSFQVMVEQAVIKVTAELIQAGIAEGSELLLTPAATTITSPLFKGYQGTWLGFPYLPGPPPITPVAPPSVPPLPKPSRWALAEGRAPFYPRTGLPK